MKLGDKVIKTKGYKWPGVIVADFENTNGERRLVVESTSEGTEGALHIYNPGQLEVVSEPVAGLFAVAEESACSYITPGKAYPIINDGSYFNIIDDVGDMIGCIWHNCSHIGGDWARVEIPA